MLNYAGQTRGGFSVFFCDGCGCEVEFLVVVGDVVICDECMKPYDRSLMLCRSRKDWDELARRIRSDILAVRGMKE